MTSNWEVGTGPSSAALDRSPFDEAEQVRVYLGRYGLEGVADKLVACGRETRMIGELRTPGAFLLPVRFEPFEELAWNNALAFGDVVRFQNLLRSTGTDLVGLPAAASDVPLKRAGMVGFVRAGLEGSGPLRASARISVDGVELYATSPAGAECIHSIATRNPAQ